MSYDVQVPERIQCKIASWKLGNKLTEEIYERLASELGKRPLEVLVSVNAPYKIRQYSFALHDEAKCKRTIVFAVEIQPDEKTLLIVDGWKMEMAIRALNKSPLPVVP